MVAIYYHCGTMDANNSKSTSYYLAICIFYGLLTLLSQHLPFFWDNVALVSRIAHFYYDSQFSTLLLPTAMDSGHPPFYGIFIAVVWSVFGKSLAVSHWAVYPFLVAIGIAYYHVSRFFLPSTLLPFAMLLLILEPTLLAQSVLAGFDLALVSFYLLGLCGILYRKRWLLAIALTVLVFISLRGVLSLFMLGACHLFFHLFNEKKQLAAFFKENVPAYIPAVLLFAIWLVYHHAQTGFWFSNPDSQWAEYYQFVDVKGFLWNLAIVGWRFLDYGRVAIWLPLFVVTAYFFWKKRETKGAKKTLLTAFILLPLLIFIPPLIIRTVPIVHRYFIVFFLLGGIGILAFLNDLLTKRNCSSFVVICLFLISGHWWIYPDHIAKGWDGSLACLPYFSLIEKAHQQIDNQQISYNKVGSEFPAVNEISVTHLNDDNRHFIDKEEQPLKEFNYILQSNVMNDFSPSEMQLLDQHFNLKKEFRRSGVYICLYRNKNTTE